MVDEGELTLDDLAARSGLSSRTIRFYQSQGLIPKPDKVGREARYRAEHVRLLQLVGELQERGLKLDAIRDLLALESRGAQSVADWLGLDTVLRSPWIAERPRDMTLTEVHELLGERPRRLVGELVDAELIVRHDDGTFILPSPALVDLAVRLVDAGATVEVAAAAIRRLRKHLARGADDLVELFDEQSGRAFAGLGTPPEVAAALDALRPIAIDAAGVILAQEMERALRRLADKGPRRRRRD